MRTDCKIQLSAAKMEQSLSGAETKEYLLLLTCAIAYLRYQKRRVI